MRAVWTAGLFLMLALAGCADEAEPTDADTDGFGDRDLEVDAERGGIRGVVVDASITPVPEATVVLSPGADAKEAVTDDLGRFTFGGLEPGTYILEVTKQLYDTVQSSVQVEAGVKEPPVVRIQLTRLISEEPFMEGLQQRGQIVCSYRVVLITAPCVTDYTTILCNGGCAGREIGDQIRSLQGDTRDFRYSIGPNWKSHIIEMVWESSAQGTSDELSVVVSYMNRTAADWFARGEGPSPVHLHMKEGTPGPNPQGQPAQLAAEGEPEMLTFVNVGGPTLQVSLQQHFEIFITTSYHLNLPDDWSVVNGDDPPF